MKITLVFFISILAMSLYAGDINVNGYTVKQFDASHTYTLPDTVIHEGDLIVIARDCSKGDFETFWNVVLGSNVLFINSGNTLPMINGDESFAVYDSMGNLIDSTNTQMPPGENKCMERDSSNVNTWTALISNMATPGYYGGGNHNAGLVITEFTDSTGSGNYIYEYVELYNDPNITGIHNGDNSSDDKLHYEIRNNILFIENPWGRGINALVQLFNIAGQETSSAQCVSSSVYIPLKQLPAGKYIIRVTDGQSSVSTTMIKM